MIIMDKRATYICGTFRRIALLEEAISCFLAQEYDGPKHLVVVNDEPEQTLEFDHPEVTIVNLKQRISLEAKRNIAAAERITETDVFFHMDDDDLFASERTEKCIEMMANGEIFKTDDWMLDTSPPSRVVGRTIANYA